MKINQKVIPIVVLLLASLAAAPASASAGPLLSGYGGPGQGSQAILGATLLNGPSGGGGGTSAVSAPAGAGPAAAGEASATATHRQTAARNGKQTGGRSASEGKGAPSTYQPYVRALADRVSSGDSGVLGLSGSHLLFVLLALAALLFAGLLTRGLAHGSGARRHAGN